VASLIPIITQVAIITRVSQTSLNAVADYQSSVVECIPGIINVLGDLCVMR